MLKVKTVKKAGVVLGLCFTMLFSMGLVANAATTAFTLTVNSTAYKQDNLSKRTLKAGGSSYENKCYVKATSFSNSGTAYVQSINLNDSSIHSVSEIALRSVSSLNQTQTVSYNKTAHSNQYYYLKGRFGAASSGSISVAGRYTP